ncbi:uncharacterized protein LOC132559255 isoform X2 [Ylistrum balloti]|uniref:uncharacterized protein LOC132559255 isoform X2 n=1 Tax=Ylistrum balloti TaxID=509963 RepID=UPI002905F52F|nr:uncharacterized protein LOC132559255 isoform X2 [Ylistrum balloti]
MEVPDVDRKEVRRPMNAFLIFCKRHRTMVREKNPHLDNRSVTRILGDLWANLQEEEKSQYTDLAKQYKDAFMKANPDYKWHNPDRLTHCQAGKPITRPSNIRLGRDESDLPLEGSITPGKLADPSNMGGLSNLLIEKPTLSDSQKLASAKPATTPQSSVASLMDLAMMCSSELSDDQMMSYHHGYDVDPSNRVLDLTTKREISSDSEKVRSNDSVWESKGLERDWSSGESGCSDSKVSVKCGEVRSSGQVVMDSVMDKLYRSGSDMQPNDSARSETNRTVVSRLTSSKPSDAKGFSGTSLEGSANATRPMSGFDSFLMKKSPNYELLRGDSNFGGRKRCYSETSVDIFADKRKLQGMLRDNGNEENTEQASTVDQEFGESDNTEDGIHPVRKSKRRNRGQRYQELINEGIIQPSKERMAVIKVETENSRNEQDSEEESVPRPMGDLGFDVLSVYPRQIRKRTCSESEKTRTLHEDMRRYKTGDFDLEAHIATLPACSLEKMSRNSKRPAGKVRSMSESCGRSNSMTDTTLTPAVASTPTPTQGVTSVPEVVLIVPPHLKPNKQAEPVTGSQRRKARKHSVTHLQIVRPQTSIQGKTEGNNTVQKTEACQGDLENRSTPNINANADVIKAEKKNEGQSSEGNQKIRRSEVSQKMEKSMVAERIERSEVKEGKETLHGSNGNSRSVCNMIDNILVSQADRKENTPDIVINNNLEAGQDNYVKHLLLNSSEASNTATNIVAETVGTSLPSEMIVRESTSATSQQINSIDVLSSSSTKTGYLGPNYSCEGFTNLKTPTAGKEEQKSLCILSTEANNSLTSVGNMLNSSATISQARGNNSPQFNNDERSLDVKIDSGDVHLSVVATSSASSPFISDVPCVAGQEYKVNPPQQVAVVNS